MLGGLGPFPRTGSALRAGFTLASEPAGCQAVMASVILKRNCTPMERFRSSRQRYLSFVQDYRKHRLDEAASPAESKGKAGGKRREYLREYLRWLRPHRFAVGALFVLALIGAGLQMVEPLFMRFIVDRVLLANGLDRATRFARLNFAGLLFLALVIVSNSITGLRDYRQRLVNTRVMLALRRSLFERLLHLPLPKLWDMKTGGILSRLTGDVDTTTGLLQMAIVSPSISVIRLIIAIGVLMALNWRLALTALAIIPGIMAISFIFAKRIRPIYRSVRKDAELIDGRVGETFSGIRVVRAFRREVQELGGLHAGAAHGAPQRAVRAAAGNGDLDLMEPDHGGGQRGDRLVRRVPATPRRRVDRRHHGVPVVHVPAAQPGVEHRQLVFRTAALAWPRWNVSSKCWRWKTTSRTVPAPWMRRR